MNHLPIHRVDNGQQPYLRRHHTARYYAHRVKESLTTRVSKFICTIFLFLLFLVGLIAFILWLSLRPHRPRHYIEDFSIPALAQPNSTPDSAVILFNVTIRNSNQKVVVHFDHIESAVYYNNQLIGGAPLVTEPFDQEAKNSTVIYKQLSGPSLTLSNQLWTNMQSDRAAGSVVFQLEITSDIKFHIFSWDSRRHKMHAKCVAVVGPDGVLLPAYRDKRCYVYFT